VKYVLLSGALFVTASAPLRANPWDVTPPSPQRNLADSLKATSKPGQASPLNPSCEGKTGDACVRSEESSDSSRPKPAQASGSPERGRK
jgi:hypothetical protein